MQLTPGVCPTCDGHTDQLIEVATRHEVHICGINADRNQLVPQIAAPYVKSVDDPDTDGVSTSYFCPICRGLIFVVFDKEGMQDVLNFLTPVTS